MLRACRSIPFHWNLCQTSVVPGKFRIDEKKPTQNEWLHIYEGYTEERHK